MRREPEDAPWRSLEAEHPQAANLALLSCLPVRVSPAFLRLVRLKLLPGSDTGDEADLWLSDLVEARAAAGFGYRRAVRARLRQHLAAEPALLHAVWHQAHLPHAQWLSPRARLEEELTWRLLRNSQDPWLKLHWQQLIEELSQGAHAEGLARWVQRAIPDLPATALDNEIARKVWVGAHLLLGDASVLGEEPQRFLDSAEFAFATRALPRRPIWVGLGEGGLIVSPLEAIENGHRIEVPATRPVWLQVEDAGEAPSSVLLVDGTEARHWPSDAPSMTLRLIDGSAHRLGPPTQTSDAAVRAPRVAIEYEVEVYGAVKQVQLPFVIGVMADLSGETAKDLPSIEDRKFLEIDRDNFDSRLKEMWPRLVLAVADAASEGGQLRVELRFESLKDFQPPDLIRRVPVLASLLDSRRALQPLLVQIKQGDRRQVDWNSRALRTVAQKLHKQHRLPLPKSSDPEALADALVAALEQQLAQQLDAILHHPEFQRLEAAWLGLQRLVYSAQTDEMLKVRVFNVGKAELARMLAAYRARGFDQSPLFRKIHHEELDQFGGQPFGLLVGDYAFDHSVADVALLTDLSHIAAASFAPFIAGASPALLQMSSWQGLAKVDDLRHLGQIEQQDEFAAWRELRGSENARYLALAMPHFLARLPCGGRVGQAGKLFNDVGSSGLPPDPYEFSHRESFELGRLEDFVWSNSAYLMALNIAHAFSQYGWCARIQGVESGGFVGGLPELPFPTDNGGLAPRCSSEVAIGDQAQLLLVELGLLPLWRGKGPEGAAFLTANSLQQPAQYDDPDASANAVHAARWPYLLACCRFGQYIRCILRDKIGSFKDAPEAERYLNQWLMNYVDGDPERSSPQVKTQRPLAAAEVMLEEIPGAAAYWQAKLFLRPHHQLEGLTVSLRLVTRVPSSRSA